MRFLLEFYKWDGDRSKARYPAYTVQSQADIFNRLMLLRSRKTLESIRVCLKKTKRKGIVFVRTRLIMHVNALTNKRPSIYFDPAHLNDPDRLDELSGQIWNWLIIQPPYLYDRSSNPVPRGFRKKL